MAKKLLIKVRCDIGERIEGVCGVVLPLEGWPASVIIADNLGYDSLLFSWCPWAGGATTFDTGRYNTTE